MANENKISQIQVGSVTYDIHDAAALPSNADDNYALAVKDQTNESNILTVDWDGTLKASESIETVDPHFDTTASSLPEVANRAFHVKDVDNRIVSYLQASEGTNGTVCTTLGARRMNSSTEMENDNKLDLYMWSDGTRGVSVSDSAAWRSALGLGTTRPGTILWSGAMYMINGQTATLSANVSTCLTGIVLHWQAYSNGAVGNYDHNYTFVPKTHTNGGGVNCILGTGGGNAVGFKYVYVMDDHITGNDVNDNTGATTSGITVSSNKWVLSEVIAV